MVETQNANGKYAFYIIVAPVGNVNIESYIDNIRIVKRGTNQDFYTLDGKPYDPADGSEDDDKYGTYEDGLPKNIITRESTPIDEINNLDFEQGFRYWGTYWNDSVASDFAEIVKENGNTYVKLKPNANDGSGGFRGISTIAFYLDNVNVNDKLTLIYDYKGDTAFSVQLLQITKQGEYRRLVGAGPTANGNIKSNAPNGFSTTWGQIESSVVETQNANGKYAFYIIVAPVGNVNIESFIDNIRIVKRGTNQDFYTLDGELYDPAGGSDDGGKDPGDGGDDQGNTGDSGEGEDRYGTYEDGLPKDVITRDVSPVDGMNNFDFEQGFRYWGTYWNNSTASDFAELIKEDGNTYAKLKPNANDGSGGWRGPSTMAFALNNVKPGDNLSVLYNWKGDADFAVQLKQLQLPSTAQSGSDNKCGAGPLKNLVKIGETDNDWNTSWQYVLNPVLEDTTNDGKYVFYILFQPTGNVKIETYLDNFQIVKLVGNLDNPTIYDLDGNILSFSDDNTGDDNNDNNDNNDNSNNNDDNNNGNNGGNSTVDNNNGSNSNSNNTGNGSNSGSTSGGNYNANNGNSGNNWSGLVNADDIDITDAMNQINKLNSGETVDFITLFNLDSSNGGINAYISIKTLTDKELKALKSMTEEQLKNMAVTLRAILSTMVGTPNTENAKAFKAFGGNPQNTLPLSFTGHINLDFTVNIRIKMASGSLSTGKTYYAYHCNPDTRVIDNLGKVYLEEENGNTYVTLRTKSFSDFFISPDTLKAPANVEEPAKEGVNNVLLWIIILSIALVLIVAAVITVIIVGKHKKNR